MSVAPSLYDWYYAQSHYFAAYYAENTAASVIVDSAKPNNYCVAYNSSGTCATARCEDCLAGVPAATIWVAIRVRGHAGVSRCGRCGGDAWRLIAVRGPVGCSPPTKYVALASANSVGVITAVAQATSGLNGETFVLAPNYSSGRVDWTASGSCKTRAGGSLC